MEKNTLLSLHHRRQRTLRQRQPPAQLVAQIRRRRQRLHPPCAPAHPPHLEIMDEVTSCVFPQRAAVSGESGFDADLAPHLRGIHDTPGIPCAFAYSRGETPVMPRKTA